MIEVDIYNDETGEKVQVRLFRNDLAYEYIIDIDEDGESFEKQGTIYHVDTLPMIEIVQHVLRTVDG